MSGHQITPSMRALAAGIAQAHPLTRAFHVSADWAEPVTTIARNSFDAAIAQIAAGAQRVEVAPVASRQVLRAADLNAAERGSE